MHLALLEAEQLGLSCVQVFTKNQQQWKVKPLEAEAQALWHEHLQRLGWQGRIVSHASYLINLASPDDELWKKSIDLMRVEIERCEALGISFLVHHPGAFTTSSREQGLERIALAYEQLFKDTAGCGVVSCLENTVGSGSNLGSSFNELGLLREMILDKTAEPNRVGFCIDTCHAHAAGYDLSDAAKTGDVLADLNRCCGLSNVRVVHLNDSLGGVGSRKDRHAHIGEGTIGLEPGKLASSGFSTVLNTPELQGVPMILETPKGQTPEGVPLDTINLQRLRSLVESA
jgi:deoxyribonuclease IV